MSNLVITTALLLFLASSHGPVGTSARWSYELFVVCLQAKRKMRGTLHLTMRKNSHESGDFLDSGSADDLADHTTKLTSFGSFSPEPRRTTALRRQDHGQDR